MTFMNTINVDKRLTQAAVICLLYLSTIASHATASSDKKVIALYEQAVALHDQIERESGHTVQVNGIRLHYLDFGPKEGVPLIWSHGSGRTGFEMLNVKDGLIAAGYRVIAVDYRGHGKTQDIDPSVSIYHQADDIVALMDHLHIKNAVLGGWSYGGGLATAFYDEYPKRTLGLLLEDGGSSSHQQRWDEKPGKKEFIKMAKKSIEMGKSKNYRSRYEAFQAAVGSDPSKVSIEMAVNLLSQYKISPDGKWRYHVSSELTSGQLEGFELDAPSRNTFYLWTKVSMIPEVIFRNLDIPLHIIDPVSDNDYYPITHQNTKLQAQHPEQVTHEIYENTSHSAHLERPERFIKSAAALLTRVKSGR